MLNSPITIPVFDLIYPVGSIYISATLTTVEQVQAMFGGEWELFGEGRCLVGKDSSTEFNTMLKTGGEKVHTLSVNEMPSHGHRILTYTGYNKASISNTYSPCSNSDDLSNYWGVMGTGSSANTSNGNTYQQSSSANSCGYSYSAKNGYKGNNTRPIIENNGNSQSHNNLQPYIVVSMFKRTKLGGGINYYAYCFLILLKGGK